MIRLGRLRKIISSKKIIIFLLVLLAIGILGGFSNASWIGYGIVGQEFTNISYQNLDLVITNNVNLFTNIDISQDNKLLSITNKHFYFWSGNNLQFYDYSTWDGTPYGLVGNVGIYFICDYVDTESPFSTFSNCQIFNYNFSEVSSYLSKVRLGDMVYYGNAIHWPMRGLSDPFFFAINVSQANKLIGFYDNVYGTYIHHNNHYCEDRGMDFGIPCIETTFDRSTVIDIGEYSYSNFPKSLLGNSPIASSIPTPDVPNTQTNQIACPTIQQLINTYGSNYNINLCYSSNMIYSGGSMQNVTPKTIFELYPTYSEYSQDINMYTNYCTPPATTESCQSAFNGKTEEYTLLSKINNANVNRLKVYTYCNLQLNFEDKNVTTCTISTGALENIGGITIQDQIDNITDEDITVVMPGRPNTATGENGGTGNNTGSGSVFDKIIGNTEDTEDETLLQQIQKATEITNNMKSIYTKLTGIFRAREGKEGIIPREITSIILLIVLFKLFKK